MEKQRQTLEMAKDGKILCTTTRLRQAARTVTQFYDKVLQPSGLLSTQLPLLALIRTAGSITISELAAQAIIDRTTLTRNLRILEQQALISSSPGQDKRRRELRLTHKGEKAVQKAIPLWEQAQRQIIEGMGEDHWQVLLEHLEQSIRAVQRD